METRKRWLAFVMAIVLLITCVPVPVWAAENKEDAAVTEELSLEVFELPEIQTSAEAIGLFTLDESGKVALQDGNYENWIERLDLEGASYALDFYHWLEDNANASGALADYERNTTILTSGETYYVYEVVVFEEDNVGSVLDLPQDERLPKAEEMVVAQAEKNNASAVAHINAVFNAFDRDHPEVFWLSGASSVLNSYSYGYDSEGKVYYSQSIYFLLKSNSFDIRASAYQTAEAVSAGITERDTDIANILNQIPEDASRYEAVKQINTCLTQMNCYNSSTDLNSIAHSCRECISALSGQVGELGPVCEGYARAFKVLCDELEIPCILVDGFAKNNAEDDGEAHMWNYVQMEDGNWYAVDVTWNDPVVSGIILSESGYENEDYLLVGSETVIDGLKFIESHPVSNTVSSTGTAFTNGPKLSEQAYSVGGSEPEGTVSGSCGESATWTMNLESGSLTISGSGAVTQTPWMDAYKTQIKAVTVESGITGIPSSAFQDCTALVSAEIADSVETLEYYAFYGCTSLESVELPEAITTLRFGVFYGCSSLTDLEIPENVLQIQSSVFAGCSSLSAITIPAKVDSIGPVAFSDCGKLEKIVFPGSVQNIANIAFKNCTALTEITFNGDAPAIDNTTGEEAFVNVTATAYYPADNDTWTEAVMQQYGGTITWVAVGESLEPSEPSEPENVVSGSCGENAVWEYNETTNVLTVSGSDAITDYEANTAPWRSYTNDILKVVIKEGITSIGACAFYGCTALTDVAIPEGVLSIRHHAFYNCCKLESVDLPETLIHLGDSVFGECQSMTEAWIPASVTDMDAEVFDNPNMLKFQVAEENTAYSSDEYGVLFNKEKTQLLAMPRGYKGEYTVPETVVEIADISDCRGLTALKLPEGLETIGTAALAGCYGLTELTIPANVSRIQWSAFFACENLSQVKFEGNAPVMEEKIFQGVTATVYYPANDDTWTDEVMQQYEGNITWTAYGDEPVVDTTQQEFTTFGELKELAAGTYTAPFRAIYVGTEALTIMENLTLPNNLWLKTDDDVVVIPEGVTLTAGFYVFVKDLTVAGTLNCNQMQVFERLVVTDSGKLTCKGMILAEWDASISGTNLVRIDCTAAETERIQEILAKASENSTTSYNIMLQGELDSFTLNASLTIPGNVSLNIFVPEFVIPAGVTLTSQTTVATNHAFVVEGSFVNDGNFILSGDDASLRISDNGSYSGSGPLSGYTTAENLGQPKISGIDLNDYHLQQIYNEMMAKYQWMYYLHSFESVVTAPTCTKGGYTTHTCACGEVRVDSQTAATGHKDTAPADFKCDVCGIAMCAEHTEQTVPGKAATCTDAGLTDGKKCSVCGITILEQQTIPAKGHTMVKVPGKDATCTASGLTDGEKCSVCGLVTATQQTILAKGHTEIKVSGKAATCTASGLTDGKKCSVCGIVTAAQQTIPAKGHTEVKVSGKAATCTASGLTEGKKCSICGSITVAQKTIAAKGHTETKLAAKAATCTATGLTEGKKCSTCGKITVAQKTVAKLAHKEVALAAKPATSTSTGLTAGKKCSVCGTITVAQNVIPKLVHNTLASLTAADYLAFSAIAYLNFDNYAYASASNFDIVGSYKTVQQSLTAMGKWNSTWSKDQKITYAQLCGYISDWQVLTYCNNSNSNGFYAVAFKNANNEVVIAYRGSVPLDKVNQNNGWDAIQDWAKQDLPAELFNKVIDNSQFRDAFKLYEKIAAGGRSASKIAVTGHSLGGGLGNIVSAKYGCKGHTTNAISILDAIYDHIPAEMGKNFTGVDKWNFTDHANNYDLLAGMFEYYVTTQVKPYISYKPSIYEGTIAKYHGLDSYVRKDSTGAVIMTNQISKFTPSKAISVNMEFSSHAVDFGSSGKDSIKKGLSFTQTRTTYGGSGNDELVCSTWADTIIGGKGSDTLDGRAGSDTYIYYKGDGVDKIHDTDGHDVLYLYGFADSDNLTVQKLEDSDYVNVKCNGSNIVQIAKKNREFTFVKGDSFTIKLVKANGSTKTFDITDAFYRYKPYAHTLIACPVDVEILDAQGNVVFTLKDGVEGSYYTDYGNFYVFQEEDGEYGKLLELAEGYTARAVGNEEGTMDVMYQSIEDGELGEQLIIEDVPVTAELTAVVEENAQGEVNLLLDTDSDGTVDETAPVVKQEHSYDAVVTRPTCGKDGYITYTCTVCGDTYQDSGIKALWHMYENGVCIFCGESEPEPEEPTQPSEPVEPGKPETSGVTRLAGNSRYETSFAIANEMKAALGIDKFDTIVLANSDSFADALAGSYLAAVKKAPIIIAKQKYAGLVCEYLNANLAEGGTIYILGGTVAMPDSILADMAIDYVPQRLAGDNRYDTNLAILGEAGVSGKDILVATGQDFADSLSASATGLPILLVNGKPGKTLSDAQKAFLAGVTGKIYIIGGESAVPTSMVQQIEAASGKKTERIAGGSRYETSVKIAGQFLGGAESAVVAYASTFPDGLCGGPLAYAVGAPLILTKDGKSEAPDYTTGNNITSGYVLGGDGLISDDFAKTIFQAVEIIK